ncbi:MAG TPA: ABC transporter ATP-binding protein, partial [Polyangiaceae bacterium]|nr:ABC transporter ATP-binding protein [Polyangiaceae bacterium]
SVPVAAATGVAAFLFRVGNRGGLRKFAAVWREVAGKLRRARYLAELGISGPAAKELRIFGLVGFLRERYTQAFFEIYDRVSSRRREIYYRPYLFFTAIGLGAAAWAMVSLGVGAASGGVSLGAVALGVQAVTMALLLGEYYPECDVPTQHGMTAVMALDEVSRRVSVFERAAPQGQLPVARELPSRTLSVDGVSFRYAGSSRDVLDGLQLELPAGKCTAVVGVNGAGKTTLVKLLTRLYEPTRGAIRADGCDIAELDPRAWRRQVSVIFQDFVRYELSAADNIALGAAHVARDRAAIERAAEQAGILQHFSSLPRGLDTPLAAGYDGGVDLSGGQWQRVAIARSLYALGAGARLLILDEPTSALDVRAEAAFFDNFVELTRGVTSLLISHRFSSVRRADRIAVVDGGRVVELGSHDELVALDGQYAALFKLQAERFTTGPDAERAARSADTHVGRRAVLEAS